MSDRETERYWREYHAEKWFCNFILSARTPDHSTFGYFRQRLRTRKLMDIFVTLRHSQKDVGLGRKVLLVLHIRY
ncbi:MAG: transposase [Alphaproteobacteria bacterium]|nr:transposase [Alphaproteobacteria bacterium]